MALVRTIVDESLPAQFGASTIVASGARPTRYVVTGGYEFVLTINEDVASDLVQAYMYARVAGSNGAYSESDGANRPLGTPGGILVDGDYIRVLIKIPNPALPACRMEIKSFHVPTRTWVAGSITGGPSSSSGIDIGSFLQTGVGNYAFSYVVFANVNLKTQYIAHYTGGTWTNDIQVELTTDNTVASGNAMIWDGTYYQVFFGLNASIYHRAYDTSFSPAAAKSLIRADLFAYLSMRSAGYQVSIAPITDPVLFGGEIWMPAYYHYDILNPDRARPVVLHATAGQTSPSWTMDDICTEEINPAQALNSALTICVTDSGANLTLAWAPSNPGVSTTTYAIKFRKRISGTWDAAATNYVLYASGTSGLYSSPRNTWTIFDFLTLWLRANPDADNGFEAATDIMVRDPGTGDIFWAANIFTPADVCCCADFAY